MTKQIEHAKRFHQLHVKGDPLILFNVWDAGSAKAIQEIGAKAIATGSWAVAAAHGYGDGEKLPLELVLANAERIVTHVDLPVTIDFEGGYGKTPVQLYDTIAQVIQTGAVGINFEDQVVSGEGLYPIAEQVARIKAVRETADRAGIPFFINARTDIFLKLNPAEHNDSHLEDAIERAYAYAQAGASGFFAPGLRDAKRIEKLCAACQLPVNILVLADTPSPKQLSGLGVARMSYGGGSYRQVMNVFKEAGRKALALSEE